MAFAWVDVLTEGGVWMGTCVAVGRVDIGVAECVSGVPRDK